MKMKSVIFNTEEVKATIAGRKSSFRAVINTRQSFIEPNEPYGKCPFGKIGDEIFVKENWGIGSRPDQFGGYDGIEYKADQSMIDEDDDLNCYNLDKYNIPNDVEIDDFRGNWQQARFMPQWASRLTLRIKDIRVEKENNLWVWVVEFELLTLTK